MKRIYDNERGIALVLALILSLVVLAAVSALVYLMTQGSAMSGYQKRYETALEAAEGAVNILSGESGIMPYAIVQTLGQNASFSTTQTNLQNQFSQLQLYFSSANVTTTSCLQAKVSCPQWQVTGSPTCGNSNNWTSNCTPGMMAPNIIVGYNANGTPVISADMSFVLQGPTAAQDYIVYSKIVDTTPGNTDVSGLNLGTGLGVVTPLGNGGPGGVAVVQVPHIYRMDILAERKNNPDERANLSILYAY